MGDCRPWPPQYRGKKATCGLAGAAIVSLGKDKQEVTKISSSTRSGILANLDASLTGEHQLGTAEENPLVLPSRYAFPDVDISWRHLQVVLC